MVIVKKSVRHSSPNSHVTLILIPLFLEVLLPPNLSNRYM